MKLESITVENYRQFEKAELTFDEGITILAGANNSGKTSLINLIKNIFVDDKLNYSAYEMTFAYYDLVMDEGIFIEEQTYVMLMNFFAHCEKILRINLNPENWKDMKWDEIIDNQINEENKITCHLRNKIRSC